MLIIEAILLFTYSLSFGYTLGYDVGYEDGCGDLCVVEPFVWPEEIPK
jgi:hypothetical protein